MDEMHPGRCGIHEFADAERARKRCDICAEVQQFIRDIPAVVRRPSHHRPATDSQKAWFGSAVKAVEMRNAERGGKLP